VPDGGIDEPPPSAKHHRSTKPAAWVWGASRRECGLAASQRKNELFAGAADGASEAHHRESMLTAAPNEVYPSGTSKVCSAVPYKQHRSRLSFKLSKPVPTSATSSGH